MRVSENIVLASIKHLLTTYGIVHRNVDFDIFNTWLRKILVLKFFKNFIIFTNDVVFYKGHKTQKLSNKHGYELKLLSSYFPDLNYIKYKCVPVKAI